MLDRIETFPSRRPGPVPRFSTSRRAGTKREHPVEAFSTDLFSMISSRDLPSPISNCSKYDFENTGATRCPWARSTSTSARETGRLGGSGTWPQGRKPEDDEVSIKDPLAMAIRVKPLRDIWHCRTLLTRPMIRFFTFACPPFAGRPLSPSSVPWIGAAQTRRAGKPAQAGVRTAFVDATNRALMLQYARLSVQMPRLSRPPPRHWSGSSDSRPGQCRRAAGTGDRLFLARAY